MSIPKLNGIDHFHLYVTDKQQAVDWYQKVLGFKIVESLKLWDKKGGPLTIEDESGKIHLALFERQTSQPSTSIAFATSGKDFVRWQAHLREQGLELRVADHQISWSMYFQDPFGNYHEITTSDHALVKNSTLSIS